MSSASAVLFGGGGGRRERPLAEAGELVARLTAKAMHVWFRSDNVVWRRGELYVFEFKVEPPSPPRVVRGSQTQFFANRNSFWIGKRARIAGNDLDWHYCCPSHPSLTTLVIPSDALWTALEVAFALIASYAARLANAMNVAIDELADRCNRLARVRELGLPGWLLVDCPFCSARATDYCGTRGSKPHFGRLRAWRSVEHGVRGALEGGGS